MLASEAVCAIRDRGDFGYRSGSCRCYLSSWRVQVLQDLSYFRRYLLLVVQATGNLVLKRLPMGSPVRWLSIPR
jgi:hypothetical protein